MITNIPLSIPNLILCCVQDITSQAELNEKIREFATLYSYFDEYASDIIAFINNEFKISRVNGAIFRTLGYNPEELENKSIFEIVSNTYYNQMNNMAKEIEDGFANSTIYEVEMLHKNNKLIPFEIISTIIKIDNKIIGTLLICRDTSLRKLLEEEHIRTQKLDSLGVLAGGIAHDFNNILTVIQGNLNLLQMELDLKSGAYNITKELEKGINQAKRISKQLITFAKGGEPNKKFTDIAKWINENIDFSLRSTNCNYKLEIEPNLFNAEIDPGQMSQVLHNLLINAVQAMPTGGLIEIIAKNVHFFNEPSHPQLNGNYIQISIKDHGKGIPENIKSKIFTPYFTTKLNGSGLGLATCYSIVKNHHGYINFETKENIGTIFTIIFPASEMSIPNQISSVILNSYEQSNAEKNETGKNTRILIVEDDPDLRKILTTTLLTRRYDVIAVQNGEEAIAIHNVAYQTNPFEYIVVDLVIKGGMGGLECFQSIRKIDPNIKGIVISGYSENPIFQNYSSYGFKAFLEKPFSPDDIWRKLQ